MIRGKASLNGRLLLKLSPDCRYNKLILQPGWRIMNYPVGVEKFIEFFAAKNGLTKEEVIEAVVIDWFAGVMTKMSLFGENLNKISPFVWNNETWERFTGEWLFKILHRRYQEELLANEGNWRRHLEYVEPSKAGPEANNHKIKDIITELKMITDAGASRGKEPESEQKNPDARETNDDEADMSSMDSDKVR
jgi:hypothetical protein